MINIETKDAHMKTSAEGSSLELLAEACAIVTKLDCMLAECHMGEMLRHMFRTTINDEEFWKIGETAFKDDDEEEADE